MYKIIILLLIIFVIIFISSIKNIERFNDNDIIITENHYNFPTDYNISPVIIDLILGEFKKSNTIPSKLLNNTSQTNASLYIDPYVNYYLLNNITNNFLYDKKGYFIYVTPFMLDHNACCWDLANKTIAYTCISDYYFINSIIKGYRIDSNTVKLIRIQPYILTNTSELINTKFDILITYVIPDSKYITFLKNSSFTITGFKDMDINRIKAFYPFVNDDTINLNLLFPDKFKTVVIYGDDNILVPSMNYIVLNNIIINHADDGRIKKVTETFITRVDLSKDAYDPLYFCYGNDTINNKFQCNSPYEVDNELKNYYSFWDKICTDNNDCPYYNKNTNKGGCNIIDISKDPTTKKNIGFCKFPIGVKRIGYTKYNDKGIFSPFCYGCNEYDLDCCKNKANPDYVYPNDFAERAKNNKETIVSKLEYVI